MAFRRLSKVAFALLCAYSFNAMAVETGPASINPGLLNQEFNELSQPPPQKPAPLKIEAPKTETTVTPEEAAAKIQIKTIQLTGFGNTAATLPPSVRKLIQQAIGKEYTFTQLQQLQAQVQAAFHQAGYILAQVVIPPQNVSSGQVTFRVLPGIISKVIIQGDAQSAGSQLRRYANALVQASPITLSELEHYLLLMNRIPGIEVKTVVSPDPNKV